MAVVKTGLTIIAWLDPAGSGAAARVRSEELSRMGERGSMIGVGNG
jgi:hypothetical protein